MRVLVVDDEEDVRLILRLQLEGNGHVVTGEAADGAEAILACRTARPDVIVLDLLMPHMNGFEAIPKLRSEFPDVAVIAYTAVAGDFVRNEMRRLGIPLVLKNANIAPLERALTEAAQRQAGPATTSS